MSEALARLEALQPHQQEQLAGLGEHQLFALRFLGVGFDVLELDKHPEDVNTFLNPASHLADDLEADSLLQIELVEAIEQEFGVRIEDEELPDIRTVGEAYDIILQKVSITVPTNSLPHSPGITLA